jgi:hypothetical protein
MHIKIRAGTAKHGNDPLCHTCRYATIVRGAGLREEIIECAQLSRQNDRITFPVTFCTKYVSTQHPSLHEMEDMAWVLRSDTKKNSVGFVRASDLPARHRFILTDDDF